MPDFAAWRCDLPELAIVVALFLRGGVEWSRGLNGILTGPLNVDDNASLVTHNEEKSHDESSLLLLCPGIEVSLAPRAMEVSRLAVRCQGRSKRLSVA